MRVSANGPTAASIKQPSPILTTPHKADWQLPPGVPRGTWDYAHSGQIASSYDEVLREDGLWQLDPSVLDRYFTQPGVVVDLGCGTGRLLLPLACRGFTCLGVDLSPQMLAIVGEKARQQNLVVDRLLANLVELDCLGDCIADYALCMLSTLGMIRGGENRRRALAHAARILKPEGLFIVHVHNRWSNLWMPQGRGWVLKNLVASWLKRNVDAGDKFFDYQDVPKMFLHLYTRGELLADLRHAGFQVVELISLDTRRQRALRFPWLLGRLRANGWIAVCRTARH